MSKVQSGNVFLGKVLFRETTHRIKRGPGNDFPGTSHPGNDYPGNHFPGKLLQRRTRVREMTSGNDFPGNEYAGKGLSGKRHQSHFEDKKRAWWQLYRVAPKWYRLLYALTSSNINRFSKLFQEKICSNTMTKDSTTSQVCRYSTL